MQEIDIIPRIKILCAARSWTIYRLAKESGITYSTLCTMLHKATAPSIPTLIKICDGFGITLAQFFDQDNDFTQMTPEQIQHLKQWDSLDIKNKQSVEKYITFLLSEQGKRQ